MAPRDAEIEGFTSKELKRAYWWITHRDLILKIVKVSLIILNVCFWGYTVYGLTKYFFLDWQEEKNLEAGLTANYIDYSYWREKNKPQDLQLSGIQVFQLNGSRYDFLVQVVNPNANWAVNYIQYSFVFPGQKSETSKETFILPGQTKYLVNLGVDVTERLADVSLAVKNIKWQRVSNYQAWEKEALNLTIADAKFTSSEELKIGKLPISKTSFKVRNNSSYNYWSSSFYVLLYQGSRIIGVSYLTKDYFDSGQVQNFEVTWFQNLSSPDRIEVIPDINILDKAVFRPVTSGAGEAK